MKPHPARFPHGLPEFFIRFLTDEDDLVIDPFAGSNVTGEVAENLGRHWRAFELSEEYLRASQFRFQRGSETLPLFKISSDSS
jgi:site-specific DNA-methyltransferase (cytosine-N4-specific)